jgi:succinate dehydrogenase / fumarate reductase flavoprotein subunit
LGGNSLSDLLVFGKRAGEHAAIFAKENSSGTVDDAEVDQAVTNALAPFEREGGENPFALQHELQDTMQDLVGIVRTESEMQQALEEVEKLKERSEHVHVPGNVDFNPAWHTALDLSNLLTVSEAITRAAIERKESRGGQYREDFPAKDAEFGKINITIRKTDDGSLQVSRVPIPEMPAELKQIIEEMG